MIRGALESVLILALVLTVFTFGLSGCGNDIGEGGAKVQVMDSPQGGSQIEDELGPTSEPTQVLDVKLRPEFESDMGTVLSMLHVPEALHVATTRFLADCLKLLNEFSRQDCLGDRSADANMTHTEVLFFRASQTEFAHDLEIQIENSEDKVRLPVTLEKGILVLHGKDGRYLFRISSEEFEDRVVSIDVGPEAGGQYRIQLNKRASLWSFQKPKWLETPIPEFPEKFATQ